MLTFFVLALSIAAALLYVAFILGSTLPILRVKNIIFAVLFILPMVVAAGVILWSIIPRIDRFVPPGPELNEADQPELFEEIRQVAAMTKQAIPAHVYLVPDVTAFVTARRLDGVWQQTCDGPRTRLHEPVHRHRTTRSHRTRIWPL